MRTKDYILYTAAALGLIGLIVLYVLEFDWFNRTITLKPLIIGSLVVGALAGLGTGYRFRALGEDLVGRIQIYIFFTVLCTLFAPLFGSLSNRLLSPFPAREEAVEFIKEEAFYADRFGLIESEKPPPTGYHLFFFYRGELHRIINDHPHFSDRERGDTILLPVRKGLWGVAFVPPLPRTGH